MLELKDYQRRSLDALEGYLRATVQHGAKTAFVLQTDRPDWAAIEAKIRG